MPKVGDPVYYVSPPSSWRINHEVVEMLIVGENSRNWLVGFGYERPTDLVRISKKTGLPPAGYFWDREKALAYLVDKFWVIENRYDIINKLYQCGDIAIFRKIADLIGYKE